MRSVGGVVGRPVGDVDVAQLGVAVEVVVGVVRAVGHDDEGEGGSRRRRVGAVVDVVGDGEARGGVHVGGVDRYQGQVIEGRGDLLGACRSVQ